jgi:hypothetical protein
VSGVVESPGSSNANEASGLKMAIVKYTPDGAVQWRKVVPESGPNLILEGMWINRSGSILLGCTEKLTDGNCSLEVTRFDAIGNCTLCRRYPAPEGYTSSSMRSASFWGYGQFDLLSEISGGYGADNNRVGGGNSILVTEYDPNGNLVRQKAFTVTAHADNAVRGCFGYVGVGNIIIGMAGPIEGIRPLMVLCY